MVYADNPVPFIVTDPVRLFHDRHTGQDNKELPLTEPYPDRLVPLGLRLTHIAPADRH